MKNLAILFFLIIFSLTAFGQTPKPTPKKIPKTTKMVAPKLGTETQEFEKAKAITGANERIAAFQNFIKNFSASIEIPRAQGLIVNARAELGGMKLQAKEIEAGIAFYKLAVQEAPTPVPDELFSKVLLGLPVSLYALDQRGGAFDIAKLIEEKIGANAGQILELSKFYLSAAYGTEAIRLAQKSVELAPDSAAAYQILATANRLNFRLEDAANAYSKSLELNGDSVINKLNLADMKRALGKTDEAIAIYREILAKDSANNAARSGLTLALFDAGNLREAETTLKISLEAEPTNAKLLTGAAYWYAAHGFGEQAIEYAEKAIIYEPRNVWSYIAKSRALLAQNNPLEAEKTLLAARQYSDFPTLDYELATVRLAAGLYREAAETLKRSFAVNKEGLVETYLDNRILADAKSFTELLSLERRSVIFEINAADNEENTNKLKSLLEFQQKLDAPDATETELGIAAEDFAKGADNMRLHRQIFAASRLLQKKTALPKVLELMQAAIGGVDSALNVAAPTTAVLADEIYDRRQYEINRNVILIVPDIPRQTLSAVLRGRIEDIAGWTYYQQNNAAQSVVRLKRALSILPDKSAWWRASEWRLGKVLETDGKEKEALDAYLKSYDKDTPDLEKRAVIEGLYQKVNGNTDGLDEKIGAKPETSPSVATTETKPEPTNSDNAKTPTEKMPYSVPVAETSETPKTVETPQPTPEIKTQPKSDITALPENLPLLTPEKTPEVSPTPAETPKTAEVKTEETPKTEVAPIVTPEPTPNIDESKITEPKTESTPSPENTEPKTDNKTVETTFSNTPKPLFEPIVINVGKTKTPKTETTKTENTQINPTEEKPSETVQKTEPTDKLNPENNPTENKLPENPPDEKVLSGENRPRIIITETMGAKTVTQEISSCKIVVSQETISLLGGGGSLGVEVSFEGDGDLKQITAESSSPRDVEVTLDPEINIGLKKLFFIVKSVSTKTGVFTVTFEASCGKKEILVKIR